MKLPTIIGLFSLAAAGLAGSEPASSTGDRNRVDTKRFIIEISKDSDLDALKAFIDVRDDISLFKTFRSNVFTGVSVESTTENCDSLSILQGVSNVWRSRRVKMSEASRAVNFTDDMSAATFSIHGMTGVDKLHDAGITGKGVKVAIVDSGTDYTHPALGGGLGPGFKVVGGYDLVGNSSWPSEEHKDPDNDPREQDHRGHGTHVAGILAGKTATWQGVAPDVSILSYKVFGSDKTVETDEETLIEAFLRAHEDGADVITCSIGGAGGFSSNAWAEVASRLVDEGLVVTISAGNDGEDGAFFSGNGMSGKNVLAVASLEPRHVPGLPFKVRVELDGKVDTQAYGFFNPSKSEDLFPTNISSLPIVALSLDPADDTPGCGPLPPNITSLSDALVLVPRGGCAGTYKRMTLRSAGARYIMLFNNDEVYPRSGSYDMEGINGMIGHEEGVAILRALGKKANVTASFSEEAKKSAMNLENPFVAASVFTSLGGLYDLQVKPDVAGPGSNILSTLPGGQFGIRSGTSMATPYVAGIAALYISKHGGRGVHGPGFGRKLSARIMASCDAVRWSNGFNATDYGVAAPVFQVGNGMVNATKVLGYHTELSFSKFALNDTAHFQNCHKFNITNNCTGDVTYTIAAQSAGGYEAVRFPYVDIRPGPTILPLVPIKAAPKITWPEEVTIPAGETREVTIDFEPPEGLDETSLPMYSGKILVTGSNDEVLSIPYMGVASDVQSTFKRLWQTGWPKVSSGFDVTPIEADSSFSFNLDVHVRDFPTLHARFRYGTAVLRWDLFTAGWEEKNWAWPLTVDKDGYVGHTATWDGEGYQPTFDPSIVKKSWLTAGPMVEKPRTPSSYGFIRAYWLGDLANGSKIMPGDYVMRIAALLPFGDESRSDHWDAVSYPFKVTKDNPTVTSSVTGATKATSLPFRPPPTGF